VFQNETVTESHSLSVSYWNWFSKILYDRFQLLDPSNVPLDVQLNVQTNVHLKIQLNVRLEVH